MFQPKFRAQSAKYCPKPKCQEAKDQAQRERCRQYREKEREKGELKSLALERKKAKKELNGWICVECGKPLRGPYRYRHPGTCQQKMFAREQRTEGDWLYAEAGLWE